MLSLPQNTSPSQGKNQFISSLALLTEERPLTSLAEDPTGTNTLSPSVLWSTVHGFRASEDRTPLGFHLHVQPSSPSHTAAGELPCRPHAVLVTAPKQAGGMDVGGSTALGDKVMLCRQRSNSFLGAARAQINPADLQETTTSLLPSQAPRNNMSL